MTPPLDWGREEEREAPTGGACYQVRVTGPAPQARPLVDMPPSVATDLGAWQATLAAHDDMANGGATDPRRSANGWYEVAVWRVVGEGQQRIISVILPPLGVPR